VLVNFGADLPLTPAPEPLLAPPRDMQWHLLWSSEHPRYGGGGIAPLHTDEDWRLPGHATVVLAPVCTDYAEHSSPCQGALPTPSTVCKG
jgi:maltooligosyltrehalose trehalohydrolase